MSNYMKCKVLCIREKNKRNFDIRIFIYFRDDNRSFNRVYRGLPFYRVMDCSIEMPIDLTYDMLIETFFHMPIEHEKVHQYIHPFLSPYREVNMYVLSVLKHK